ncbi:MAG TPA: bifunctional glutamate N-acetyltransferase/amino-acid acetyltransferase ArgJ [Chromatiales bacterium]|nr:bifunctional glutamate N-acetyltransferase/amino-acid acetyltransferase ArgJ [Chromatiales bacterium]
MNQNIDYLPVPGLRLGTTCAGIRQADRRDLVVMELAEGTQTAAVFTRNAFCAAPVTVARDHLAAGPPRYLLINTGYANAGTGEPGLEDALTCCTALARLAGCATEQVLPFSTGIIGEPLPVTAITRALPTAVEQLTDTGWEDAAWGIMTTDTVPKLVSRRSMLGGKEVTVTGMAKGAGMIRPDMATLLAFVATDAGLDEGILQKILQASVNQSFNRITVDGDTSTNDACLLVATGASGVRVSAGSAEHEILGRVVAEVCSELAKGIVRDGEGATRLITIVVESGRSTAECLDVAYTVAQSPLVKTAFFAGDPNWGRILAAVGRAGLEALDIGQVEIYLDEVCIVRKGARAPEYTEAQGQTVMARKEITVRIALGRGTAQARIWTCDLSCDYVRINAEYRT